MPWDDDFDLGWYNGKKFPKEIIEDFFKLVIKKGYEIFLYYKEIYTPYSSSETDHFTIRLNSQNILQITHLLSSYEIVLFNVALSTNKYKEILKIFNMSIDFEEKYLDGTIKIPSVDIFMYEFNSNKKTYEYNKLFGAGYTISIPQEFIEPIKNYKLNKLDVKMPNNIENLLKIHYVNAFIDNYKNLDTIVIKRHTGSVDKQKEIDEINKLNISVKDPNIILVTKIYNNFINKYFEIIDSNENVKKIIYTK